MSRALCCNFSQLYCNLAKVIFLAPLLLTVVLSGCAPKQPPAPPPPPPPFEHTVQQFGETLGTIAKWYTGNQANYKAILLENPGLEPRKITLGTIIRIPEHLLVRRDPLPKKALVKRESKQIPVRPPSAEPTNETAPTPPQNGELGEVAPPPLPTEDAPTPSELNNKPTIPQPPVPQASERAVPPQAQDTLAISEPALKEEMRVPPQPSDFGSGAEGFEDEGSIEESQPVAPPVTPESTREQKKKSLLEEMLDGK
jgi:hypothetical protein